MEGEAVGMLAVLLLFGMPITAIITSHFRKMAEIKMRQGQSADSNVSEAIRDLKDQFNELRDTTTKYPQRLPWIGPSPTSPLIQSALE